jgi:hypothetical protein
MCNPLSPAQVRAGALSPPPAVPPVADVPCWWCGKRPGDLVSLRGEDMVICGLCLEALADDGGDRWSPSLDAALARERRIDGILDAERSAVADMRWGEW